MFEVLETQAGMTSHVAGPYPTRETARIAASSYALAARLGHTDEPRSYTVQPVREENRHENMAG